MITRKRGLAALAVAAVVAGGAVVAQQSAAPRHDHSWAPKAPAGKHHTLAATLETVQWGWLDPNESPRLTINSGDTVSIETMMHSHDQVRPGVDMNKIVELRKANPGGGPHSMTGPIFVNGREPGDVLEIRSCGSSPSPSRSTSTSGQGISHDRRARFRDAGRASSRSSRSTCSVASPNSSPGSRSTLQPFPGTLAVGIDPNDPSPRKGGRRTPWRRCHAAPVEERLEHGHQRAAGRLDDLHPGVSQGRAHLDGDSHCRQGNGEVSLTALECSYKEIRLQPIVRKDMKIDWPFIETRTHWITTGFNEDLNVAMTNAVARGGRTGSRRQKMVPMDRYEAYSLVSMAGDCRVSQVVDVRKGVHCMIPKSIFTKRS
jgi:acetamidase/formamidase